jgi:hypothetical protein
VEKKKKRRKHQPLMEMTEIFCLVKKKKKKRWKRQPLMEKDRNILSSEKEEEKMDRNVSP